MYIRKYSRILDYFFITTSIILLTFCWIRFYTHNSTLSIVLAIILGVCIGGLSYIINSKRLHKQQLTSTNLKRIQALDFQLSFANSTTITNYFSELLSQHSTSTTTKDDYLILPNNTVIYPYYLNTIDEITIKKILSNTYPYNNIIIVCSNYDKNLQSFCQNINNIKIQLLTTSQFMNQFCQNTFNIPNILDVSKPKLTIRQILKAILDHKKSKTYLTLGVLLMLYTFIIPFKIYYLIFGSTLLILGILSHFSKKIN